MPTASTPRRSALVAGALLLLVYGATAARTVTFWDAGEFLAAFHTLGIPHPPGTPLFVLLGRVAVLSLAPLGPVLPASLLSAACTAAAGALSAALVARWTGQARLAVAAALCAGATASVWLDATEPEAYASALALAACCLAVGERAGRDTAGRARWCVLLAYLLGVAVPLHLSALVVAPAAVLLAATDASGAGHTDGRAVARLGGVTLVAMGAGTSSLVVAAAGLAIVLGDAWIGPRRALRRALAELGAVALGASAVLVLLVRARHDPTLNQGDPSTWHALADVVARRQYAVAPPWPRQAPWWLQLANVGEWADWQFALGLDGGIGARPLRTPFTIAYAALGVLGARRLRDADRRGFRATLALLLAGSLGVAAYLNLKAGPSFGVGVLPNDSPHEARERDYFFALAFWTWGLWAGIGAVALAERVARRVRVPRAGAAIRWAGVAVAALPIATNWHAATRTRAPEAALPRALADALLASVPPRSVLLAIGDNDTYPVWYVQLAEGVRRDVVPVTIPLLGAPWYRGELARRHGLLPPGADRRWIGEVPTLRAIADAAASSGRPLALSAAAPESVRVAIGGRWTLAGVAWIRTPGGIGDTIDRLATSRVARRVAPAARAPLRAGGDGVAAWAQALLRCAPRAAAGVGASLDATCNSK